MTTPILPAPPIMPSRWPQSLDEAIRHLEELYGWADSFYRAVQYELSNNVATTIDSRTFVEAGLIGSTEIADGSVTTVKVADVAIDDTKLATAAVTTAKIANLAVDTEQLASLAVEAAKLAGTHVGNQISVSGITAGVCATTNTQGLDDGDTVRFGAGGSTAYGFYTVSSVVENVSFKLDDTTITDATGVSCYIATEGCITYEKIQNAAIGKTAIANAAIGTAHIGNAVITEALIANLAVSSAKIANLAVEEGKINSLAVTEGKIGALAVTNAKINDCAIDKLTAGSITSKAITLAIAAGTGDVKIQAGRTDFGQTTNGFILGMDDSASDKAKFEIGNGETRFFKFDGADILIGQDSRLEGTACYNNYNIFYADPLGEWIYEVGGAGACTSPRLLDAGSVAADYAKCKYLVAEAEGFGLNWGYSKRFKVNVCPIGCTNATIYICVGDGTPNTNGAGLKIVNYACYAFTKNAAGESTTDLDFDMESGGVYPIEIYWDDDAGTVTVTIWSGGVQRAQDSNGTRPPSGESKGSYIFLSSVYKDTGDANRSMMQLFGLHWLQINGAGGFVPPP